MLVAFRINSGEELDTHNYQDLALGLVPFETPLPEYYYSHSKLNFTTESVA